MLSAEDIHDESHAGRGVAREDTAVSLVRTIAPFNAAGATHVGQIRPKNEDRFAIVYDLGLCVVADGMGGHAAGDVAAELAIDEVAMYLREAGPDPTPQEKEEEAEETAPRLTIGSLALAVQHANKAIHLAARNEAGCNGMGTTIAAVLVVGAFAFLAHVGDSRVYRQRGGKLQRLTEDHSWANEYLRMHGSGADLHVAKARSHILTRCLGSKADVRVAVRIERFEAGDLYLLCTDGLWNVVEGDAIAQVLSEAGDLPHAASRLVDLANAAGGTDNITAILVRPIGASADETHDAQA